MIIPVQAKGVLFQPASEFLPMIEEVHERLAEATRCIPGAKVENNKFCVSVHFRCVDEKVGYCFFFFFFFRCPPRFPPFRSDHALPLSPANGNSKSYPPNFIHVRCRCGASCRRR